MEMDPGEDWAPQQQSRQRRARWALGELTSWEHWFNDNCKEDRGENVQAGYYPRQVGEKGILSNKSQERRKEKKMVSGHH